MAENMSERGLYYCPCLLAWRRAPRRSANGSAVKGLGGAAR
ncbi:hypothetical protein [Thioalkalivibrio sp. HK1]|nr:hypothetical protein [Thioalkalivibrio sp. HK1]